MFEGNLLRIVLSQLPWILLAFVTAKAVANKYKNGLSSIPGPWVAAYTDLWRIFVTWGRRPELAHIRLHDELGGVVRIGPNAVSVSDWNAIKKIYSPNSGYIKSKFYPVQQTISRGKVIQAMFNTTDEMLHAKLRRAASNIYSMSNLVQFEPMVDSTISVFIKEIEKRFVNADESGICAFSTWLHYYAFDVIGELTFSKRLGFLERGVDVEGVISQVQAVLDYFSLIGQIPWLDRLLLKNPVRLWLNDNGYLHTSAPVPTFAAKRMSERAQENSFIENTSGKAPPADFLTRFMHAKEKDPEFMNDQRVMALTVSNIFAGSDTTGITLSAIFYYLLKTPQALQALLDELEGTVFAREDGIVSWNEARNLPYLTAVIQESLRMHPAVGFPLERIVPAEGLHVGGHFLPAGTIVGANAWVFHLKESIFGAEPRKFRPERWLEASEKQMVEMNSALFSFGMGTRACLGKNISLLEMYKLVPTILKKFKLSLANPEAEWTLHNAWFIKQSDFNVRLQRLSSARSSTKSEVEQVGILIS